MDDSSVSRGWDFCLLIFRRERSSSAIGMLRVESADKVSEKSKNTHRRRDSGPNKVE